MVECIHLLFSLSQSALRTVHPALMAPPVILVEMVSIKHLVTLVYLHLLTAVKVTLFITYDYS